MYTYKLGGIFITDELYHDDLEAMTFGRKDQNELMHYGIKGQSWGKRRFQNEDGSLTIAGRNRYDVGDSRQGSTNKAMSVNRTYATGGGTGRFGGASGGGGSVTSKGSPTLRTYGSFMTPGGKSYEIHHGPGQSAGRTVTNKVKAKVNDTVNNGRKAADNLFSSIGNWATNAANDVGKAATNAYNGASRAVNNAADWVGDRAKDVGNLIFNQDEKQKMQDLIDKHYDPETNTFDSDGNYKKFDEARTAYLNHPLTAVSEAGKWVGDRAKDVGNAATNAWNDVSATARGVADSVGNHLTGNIDRNTAQALRDLADHQENPNAAFYSPMPKYSPENLRKEAEEYQRKADNSLFGRIGNAAKDVGNWATNAYNDASKAVTGAAQDVSDWFTGDKAGREAQRYDNVVQNFERNGDRNINEGIDTISKAINIKDKYPNVSEANFDKGIKQRDLGYDQHEIASQYGQKADEAQARYDAAPRQLLNAAGNWVSNAANDVGKTVSGAARDAGDWASNAASDVRDWGAGALDKGRQAFESLFGKSEPANNEGLDPTPKTFTENIIEEQRIPEQRITEDRIEEQRVPEQHVYEFGDPGMASIARQFMNQQNSNSSNNAQREQRQKETLSDKPSDVSDELWEEYKANGGTRDSYDREMNSRKNSQNNRSSNSSMPDKPDGVSDEFWREYTFNGGTRESYDHEMNARKNSQNNQNGSASRKEVVGTVDTSRPYRFTYDPTSGQTIVVYDDEKRR